MQKMKTVISSLYIALLFTSSCDIKNKHPEVVVEPGTELDESIQLENPQQIDKSPENKNRCLGFWVGDFEPDIDDGELQKKSF